MGTRSLIHFQEDGDTLCTVYQQYDGYPEGVGKQIYDLLSEVKIVNGIPGGGGNYANGVGCLIAQYIARYKHGAGGLYVYPPDANDCWEEFTYVVNVEDGFDVEISVNGDFFGDTEDFGQYIAEFCRE